MPRPLRTIVRFTAVFAGIGLLLGLAAMFGRVSPFADSGSSDPSFLRHKDWVPILTGLGAAFGLSLGILAAIVGMIARAARSRVTDS